MRTRELLPLLVLCALLLGGGLFWLAQRGDPAAERGARAPQTSERSSAARADLAAPEVAAADAAEERALVDTDEALPEDPAANAGSSDEPRASAPRIRGRVVGPDGASIPGALVFASSQQGMSLDFAGEDSSEWVRRWSATTDSQGAFELRGPSPGPLHVLARADGFAPLDRDGLTLAAGEFVELEPLILARGTILEGHVLGPDGRGVVGAKLLDLRTSGALVMRLPGTQDRPLAVTDGAGAFRVAQLACGPWRIAVRSDDHPTRVFEGSAESPGRQTEWLTFQVEEGQTIAGRLIGAPQGELTQLVVRAVPAREGWEFDPAQGLEGRLGPIQADGSFRVHGMQGGQAYVLQARAQRSTARSDFFFGLGRSNRVRAQAGDVGVELAYQPESVVTFQVTDAKTQEPLTDFRVGAGIGWAAPLESESGKLLEVHPGGLVRVEGLRPTEAEDRLELELRAPGHREYKRSDIAIRAGEDLDLGTIELEPIPVVRVTVLDARDARPVEGATVKLRRAPKPAPHVPGEVRQEMSITAGDVEIDHDEFSPLGGRSTRTDASGVAALSSLEGETCEVEVRHDGFAPGFLRDLFLPPGEVIETRVLLGQGGTVVVQATDARAHPLSGAGIEHRSPSELASGVVQFNLGDAGHDTITDVEGRCTFARLEPGRHAFRLDEMGGGGFLAGGVGRVSLSGVDPLAAGSWQEIEVADGSTQVLTLEDEPRATLTGIVLEAGQALVGAEVTLESTGSGAAGPMGALVLPGMGAGGPRARTDGDGRYRIEDAKVGRYELVISHATRCMPARLEIELDEGEVRQDVDLPLAIIEGRVTDAAGQPLEGLHVSARRVKRGDVRQHFAMVIAGDDGDVMSFGGPQSGEDSRSDAEGRYSLRGVEAGAELEVEARGDEVLPGTSAPLTVGADEVKQRVDLVLQPAGKIEVEARLPDGTPARFCMVEAHWEGAGGEAQVEPQFGFIESGSTTLRSLRPGPWRIQVRPARPGAGASETTEQRVEVRAKDTARVTLELAG
jgi:protocatechuate 3,4-dioxygenase beta subunit